MIKFILSVVLTYSFGLTGQYLIGEYLPQTWLTLIILGTIVVPLIVVVYVLIFFDAEMKVKLFSLLPTKR